MEHKDEGERASMAAFLAQGQFSHKVLAFAVPGAVFVGVYALLFWKRLFDDRSAETGIAIVEDH